MYQMFCYGSSLSISYAIYKDTSSWCFPNLWRLLHFGRLSNGILQQSCLLLPNAFTRHLYAWLIHCLGEYITQVSTSLKITRDCLDEYICGYLIVILIHNLWVFKWMCFSHNWKQAFWHLVGKCLIMCSCFNSKSCS